MVSVHIPMLGLGPSCQGCPEHFCDDDPAIVYGYCCGCASFYGKLCLSNESSIFEPNYLKFFLRYCYFKVDFIEFFWILFDAVSDNLPIQCSTKIECPLNGYGLCQDYEYMMHCCC